MKTEKNNLEFWLGIILLTPPLISVILFLVQLIFAPLLDSRQNNRFNTLSSLNWSSQWNEGQLMLYFGLMAIAGCILICNSRKK